MAKPKKQELSLVLLALYAAVGAKTDELRRQGGRQLAVAVSNKLNGPGRVPHWYVEQTPAAIERAPEPIEMPPTCTPEMLPFI